MEAPSSKKTLDFALHYAPKRRDHRNGTLRHSGHSRHAGRLLRRIAPHEQRCSVSALGMTPACLSFGVRIAFIAAWIFQNTANGNVALTAIELP
jgi:hypothetical protein